MLIPVTAVDLPDFTAACAHEHVFGSRMITALRAYGLGNPDVRFFLCRKGREPAAALHLAGGVLTIAADERADPAPIADLIRANEVHEVDTNWPQCTALQAMLGGVTESSYYMVYRGGLVEGTFDNMRPGDPRTVFEVLQRSHEYYRTHFVFAQWFSDWEQRLSRGLSEIYQLEHNGEVVGTGSILSSDDTCAVIGAVAVVPEHRHQGLGSYISRFLVQRIQTMGKTPRLISGYDEVAELYRQMGFAPCGRWGELYLNS